MQLRPYQKEAVNSCIDWFCEGKDRPLIVLPTGTGKSLVAAEICRDVVTHTPHARVMVVAHVKELVRQNFEKFITIEKNINTGIISAGLGKKQFNNQVLFGSIQSIYKNANKIGHIDLMIADECHLIPVKGQGMWRSFEKDMRIINPNFRMAGMTATPFRMTTGTLVGGSNPQFDGICYEYKIINAFKDGYLSEVVTIPTETHLATIGVHKRGGEFINSELEKAVNIDTKTKACCDEIIKLGEQRKTWLIFASGNSHAQNIHKYLRSKGINGYCLTQETPKTERDLAIMEHVNGHCTYLVNNMILTTGFDCPRLDLIACMRPTGSAGLWVQMVGRGTRLFEGKENCLLLDFGKNIERHGAIDEISGSEYFEKKEKGEAPIKNCPECHAVIHAGARVCPECAYNFPAKDPELTKKASTEALFSHQRQTEKEVFVIDMKVTRNKGKDGKPDNLRIKYKTLIGDVSEFFFYDHPALSFPYQDSVRRGGHYSSIDAALNGSWPMPKTIKIKKDKKYYKILTKIFN